MSASEPHLSLSLSHFALRSHQGLSRRHRFTAASSPDFTVARGDSVSLEGPRYRQPDNMRD